MRLIGVNRSPYTRRVAITLTALGVPYEQRCVSGFGNREEVRGHNPLGRIPALVLDDGETLPRAGADRRAVLRVAAMMMGACDKGLQAAYHRNHTPVEKRHQPWVDDCTAQMVHALAAVDAMVHPSAPYLLQGRLTQADITAFVAERLARFGLSVDTATQMPKLYAHTRKLGEEAAFRTIEP
jgi:glutathione S-transferase